MARVQIANDYSTTLVADVNISDTELTVNSVVGAPDIQVPGDYCMLTLVNISGEVEIVKATSIDVPNNIIVVERGQEGTPSFIFPTNSKVGNRFTAGTHRAYLEDHHTRVIGTPIRTSDTTFTFEGDLTEDFHTDRALRVIDSAGVETNMYVVSSVYTTLTTVTVNTTLPATLSVVELGLDVDWLPRQGNATTADYATNAGHADTADTATNADNAILAANADGITGKTIASAGGSIDVIPVTNGSGVLASSFLDVTAGEVSFDNTSSRLTTDNVQAAIDEMDDFVEVLPKKDVANTYTRSQVVGLQTLTEAPNISFDTSLGNTAAITLTADRILDNPTNAVAGGTYMLIVTSGDFQLTYGDKYLWPEGEVPELIGTTVLSFIFDGTNMLGVYSADIRGS